MKLLHLPPATETDTTLDQLAKKYRETITVVRQFQSKHERVFTEYAKLAEAVEVAENELRTKAKNLAVSYQGRGVDVEYVMPKHRYFNPVVIRKLVSKNILDSLKVITIKEEVDEKALKALVKLGRVKDTVLTKALVEEDTGSPRVTIKIKD